MQKVLKVKKYISEIFSKKQKLKIVSFIIFLFFLSISFEISFLFITFEIRFAILISTKSKYTSKTCALPLRLYS